MERSLLNGTKQFPMQHFSLKKWTGSFCMGFVVAQLVFSQLALIKKRILLKRLLFDRSWSQYTHQYNIKCDNLGSRRGASTYSLRNKQIKKPVFRAFFLLKIIPSMFFLFQSISIFSQVEYSNLRQNLPSKKFRKINQSL